MEELNKVAKEWEKGRIEKIRHCFSHGHDADIVGAMATYHGHNTN